MRKSDYPRVHVCVIALLAISVLAFSFAAASAEGGYAFVTKWGSTGMGDGEFDSPEGIAVDSSGNVFVADTNNKDNVNRKPKPAISVTKIADPTSGAPSTDVTFTITVENTGDCTLNPVMVVDTLPGGMSYVSDDSGGSVSGQEITWNLGSVASGAPATTISLVAHVDTDASGKLRDSVTATGTFEGKDVKDKDTADVTALTPGISVTKTASPTAGAPSTNVNFSINVTNTGDCILDPVKVVDTLPTGMSYVAAGTSPLPSSVVGNTITWNNVGPLNPTASTTITLIAHIDSGASGTLTDLVNVTGTPPAGDNVTDSDTADVTTLALGIHIDKTASKDGTCPGSDPLTVHIGDNVTYCFNVTNIGDVTLKNVTVVDDIYGNVTLGTTTLAPDESTGGTVTHIVVESDAPLVTNTATADGTDPCGVTVTDTDDCRINVAIVPGIDIEKTASTNGSCPGSDPLAAHVGDNVTYCFNVTNTGDVTLTNISISDDVYGNVPLVTTG